MIRAAIASSSLGSVLVATSEAGVCAVWMGDDPDALRSLFLDSFAAHKEVSFASDPALADVTRKSSPASSDREKPQGRYRSICKGLRFSARCGARCVRFRWEPPPRIAISQQESVHQQRFARWLVRAHGIKLPSRFLVIAWCAATETCLDIAGALREPTIAIIGRSSASSLPRTASSGGGSSIMASRGG